MTAAGPLAERLAEARPDWFDRARCATERIPPDVFYPAPDVLQPGAWRNAAGELVERGHTETRVTAVAVEVCSGCPVRITCLNYALDNNERFGVWGGVGPRARRRLLLERRARGTR